jgi:TPR repeat protein
LTVIFHSSVGLILHLILHAIVAGEKAGWGSGLWGVGTMGWTEVAALESAAVAQANRAGEIFLQLGVIYASGRSGLADRIAAHKWFNLAAARGVREAVQHRRELAAEMSEGEIAAAQRAAREWLTTH